MNSLTASYIIDLLSRADSAWEDDRCDDAVDFYRQAFLVDASIKRAAYRLGWCYNQQQRYAEAAWTLKTAVQLDPSDETILAELAFAFRSMGRFDEAVEAYADLLRINPHSVEARYNIGWIDNQRGDYREAIKVLEDAARIAPDRGDVYEDLGYAYKNTGRAVDAVKAYYLHSNDLHSPMNGNVAAFATLNDRAAARQMNGRRSAAAGRASTDCRASASRSKPKRSGGGDEEGPEDTHRVAGGGVP